MPKSVMNTTVGGGGCGAGEGCCARTGARARARKSDKSTIVSVDVRFEVKAIRINDKSPPKVTIKDDYSTRDTDGPTEERPNFASGIYNLVGHSS
jgi:hypothetical protein